ncbi:MAG: glycosyltransferase [Candidatus Bathyarchaeota archaeon]
MRTGFITISIMVILAVIGISFYSLIRTLAVFDPSYTIIDRWFSIILILGEVFLFVHGLGYAIDVLKATRKYAEKVKKYFVRPTGSKIAVFIAAFNEEQDVLKETIASASNFDYERKEIYLLDDSTKDPLRTAAEELAQRYKIRYIHRINRRGFKAGAINDALKFIDAKYLLVLDADQRASPEFLRRTAQLLEEDPKLAFVQVPQSYSNFDNSVAKSAAHQQSIFFEYISEGKNVSNAMFSCGTNVMYRIEHLLAIGGMDEGTVTEDIATSFKLHEIGCKSEYFNKVYVDGEGPSTLAAYFTQQFRWSLGTLMLAKHIFRKMITHPRSMKVGQWWEYFLSSTWYLNGWAYFFLMISSISFLLLGIRPLIIDPIIYAMAFVPYLLFNVFFFYSSMGKRGWSAKWTWLGTSLTLITFPVYMRAAVSALLGKKATFGVTQKGKTPGAGIPLTKLWPQLVMLTFCFASTAVGLTYISFFIDFSLLTNTVGAIYNATLPLTLFSFSKLPAVTEYIQPLGLLTNPSPHIDYSVVATTIWVTYHAIQLSAVFYLNKR